MVLYLASANAETALIASMNNNVVSRTFRRELRGASSEQCTRGRLTLIGEQEVAATARVVRTKLVVIDVSFTFVLFFHAEKLDFRC
jgi:hypothetical protein